MTDDEIQQVVNGAVSRGELSWLGYRMDDQGVFRIPVLSKSDLQFARAILAAVSASAPSSVMTDDTLYDFWLNRNCMDAIRAGDMRAQFISAARAAVAAASSAPQLTDEQISKAARYLSDETAAACNVDKDDSWKIYGQDEIDRLRAALTAAGAL